MQHAIWTVQYRRYRDLEIILFSFLLTDFPHTINISDFVRGQKKRW